MRRHAHLLTAHSSEGLSRPTGAVVLGWPGRERLVVDVDVANTRRPGDRELSRRLSKNRWDGSNQSRSATEW